MVQNLRAIVLAALVLAINLVLNSCSVSLEQDMSDYPSQIPASLSRPDVVYVLQPNYYAVHADSDSARNTPDRATETPIATFNDGTIAVFSGHPPANSQRAVAQPIGPVYQLQPGGSLAVPTGLAFVRWKDGESAEAHRAALEQAGYTITDIPAYAPNSAWVKANSGQISDALTHLTRLEALPNVENVEPQMILQRSKRDL